MSLDGNTIFWMTCKLVEDSLSNSGGRLCLNLWGLSVLPRGMRTTWVYVYLVDIAIEQAAGQEKGSWQDSHAQYQIRFDKDHHPNCLAWLLRTLPPKGLPKELSSQKLGPIGRSAIPIQEPLFYTDRNRLLVTVALLELHHSWYAI